MDIEERLSDLTEEGIESGMGSLVLKYVNEDTSLILGSH